MSLIDKEVIEFACFVSGRSKDEVEILLEEWKNEDREVISEMKKVPKHLIKTREKSDNDTGKESRYRYLVEKLQDPDLTAGKFIELHTELQNIEYELNKEKK